VKVAVVGRAVAGKVTSGVAVGDAVGVAVAVGVGVPGPVSPAEAAKAFPKKNAAPIKPRTRENRLILNVSPIA
jgi:hypothetical protein